MWLNHESDLHLIVYRVYFKQSAFKMANAYLWIVMVWICKFSRVFCSKDWDETGKISFNNILARFLWKAIIFQYTSLAKLDFLHSAPPHPPPARAWDPYSPHPTSLFQDWSPLWRGVQLTGRCGPWRSTHINSVGIYLDNWRLKDNWGSGK